MGKLLIINITIIVLIVAFSTGFYLYYKSSNQEANTSNQEVDTSWKDLNDIGECNDKVNQEEKDWCVWNVAVNTKEGEICSKISTETKYSIEKYLLRDFCYEKIAFDTGEINLCGKISLDPSPASPNTPELFRYSCEDNARLKIVRDTQDTTECNNIHDAYWKARCFEKIGN